MYLKMVVGICFTQNHQKIQPRLTNPMLSIKGGVMDIQRKAFEESNNVNPDWSFKFDEELQQYVAVDFEMTNQVDEFNEHWDTFRAGWDAKAQAVPEGFVLLEKKGLRDTYYWDGCEYVVDHPSEYEMELERGEIVTLEKWQRTKETNVYCANIFSDEDNFELVQFDSLEEAEKAVAANKTMIEAQEQSHENG